MSQLLKNKCSSSGKLFHLSVNLTLGGFCDMGKRTRSHKSCFSFVKVVENYGGVPILISFG